jgi:hypothetical protein
VQNRSAAPSSCFVLISICKCAELQTAWCPPIKWHHLGKIKQSCTLRLQSSGSLAESVPVVIPTWPNIPRKQGKQTNSYCIVALVITKSDLAGTHPNNRDPCGNHPHTACANHTAIGEAMLPRTKQAPTMALCIRPLFVASLQQSCR